MSEGTPYPWINQSRKILQVVVLVKRNNLIEKTRNQKPKKQNTKKTKKQQNKPKKKSKTFEEKWIPVKSFVFGVFWFLVFGLLCRAYCCMSMYYIIFNV